MVSNRVLIIICLIVPVLSFGQDIKEDLKKINESYLNNKSYSMKLEYNLYESFSSTIPFHAEKGVVKKSGRNQYYQLATIENIQNNNYSILIDKANKIIMVSKPNQKAQKEIFPIQFDPVLKLSNSVEFIKSSPILYGYRIKSEKSEYEQIEIYFNPKTYFIEKMVLFSRQPVNLREEKLNDRSQKKQKPKLEILCKEINTVALFPQEIFSEKKYIKVNNNQIECQPAFKGYQLVNTIEKTKNLKK